jgi:hypothetical protein
VVAVGERGGEGGGAGETLRLCDSYLSDESDKRVLFRRA